MNYLTYKGKQWPLRVSYYALKQYQAETGKGIEAIDEEFSNLEILLHYGLVAGAKAEGTEMDLKREDMEFFLDECLSDFNEILLNSFEKNISGKNTSKKK